MANGGVTTEQRMERRQAVAEAIASPRGLTKGNWVAGELATRFGCAESTIWEDRKWLLRNAGAGLDPKEVAAEFLARLRRAQDDAAQDGAHGPRMAGLGLEAKVLGVLAPERHEVTTTSAPGALTEEDLRRFAHWQSRWDELEEKARVGTLTDMERNAMSVMDGW